MHAETSTERFPQRITLRCPPGLPAALQIAARQALTTPSEYLRRALLQAMRADGVHLDAEGRIATPHSPKED
jgi:hypothetical protein